MALASYFSSWTQSPFRKASFWSSGAGLGSSGAGAAPRPGDGAGAGAGGVAWAV